MPGGLPLQPWAADLVKERVADNDKDNPDAHCLPMGFMQFLPSTWKGSPYAAQSPFDPTANAQAAAQNAEASSATASSAASSNTWDTTSAASTVDPPTHDAFPK